MRKLYVEEEPERSQNSWQCAKCCKKKVKQQEFDRLKGEKGAEEVRKTIYQGRTTKEQEKLEICQTVQKKMNKQELERHREMCARRDSENWQNSIGKTKKGR